MLDVYDKLPVCHNINNGKIRTADVLLQEEVKFSSLLLEENIQRGLIKCGYTSLSPIQKNALPLALTGISLIAHAKSGTGKTLIYLLTALNIHLKADSKNLHSLILAPTREIAKQIYDVLKNLSCFIEELEVEYFIGGIPIDADVLKCKSCNIAIGAPGRIKHLIDLGELKINDLQLLVLDEVDALLHNKEFAIANLVTNLPTKRQTIVCTATYSEEIDSLSKPIAADMKYVTINDTECETSSTTSNVLLGVKQYVAPVFTDTSSLDTIRKRNKMIEILQRFKYDQCFIFVNYISLVKSVYNYLQNNGLIALWVSSEQNQSTRIATLNKLKMNECRILVTTDLASRGIDVHNVNLVLNIGIPNPPDVYVHRMGRAGRFGSEGAVVTIVQEGKELQEFAGVVRAVFTEPVDLCILPREISADTLKGELPVINCTPQPDPSLSIYTFRRNLKPTQDDHGDKKKKKKRRTKAKENPALVEIREPVIKGSSSEDNYSDDVRPEPRNSLDDSQEMEKMVQQYIENIIEEICKTEIIDSDTLNKLFVPRKAQIHKVRFQDYTKAPVNEVLEDAPAGSSYQHLDEFLLNLAGSIRNKHIFLDEQKIPCSIKLFFELLDNNERIFSQYSSNSIYGSVKELLRRMRERISPPPSSLGKREQEILVKETLKRIDGENNGRASLSNSEGTESRSGGVLRETKNWILGQGSIKRTRKELPIPSKFKTTLPKTVDAPHSSNLTKPVPVYFAASASCVSNKPDVAQKNQHPRPAPIFHKYSTRCDKGHQVLCCGCQHRSSIYLGVNVPNSTVPMLQPLSTYVNCETERNIWNNHFNFIKQHVQLLPSYFGNH